MDTAQSRKSALVKAQAIWEVILGPAQSAVKHHHRGPAFVFPTLGNTEAQHSASGRELTGPSRKKHRGTPDGGPFSCACPEPLTLARHDQASVGPKEVGRTHGNFPRDVPGKGDSISLLMKAVAQRQQIPSPRELDPSVLLSEVAAV